ncbi:CE1 family esterase [Frateuria aurantia]
MTWKALWSAAALTAALWLPSAMASDQLQTITFQGQLRRFLIHRPDAPAPRGGFPLLLAFHGGGMRAQGMARMTHLDAVADQQHLVVVYPDGVDRHWNDGRGTIKDPQDDVGFTSAIIDWVGQHEQVDPDRIFATGLSNGALFTQRLGCELSSRIRAIAPVAGSMPAELASSCRPSHLVAVLQIDGTADPIMPYAGGAVADFGGRGEGGEVLPVTETTALWASRNRCAGHQQTSLPASPSAPFDPTRIVQTRYTGCPGPGQVTLLTITGGGHAWPGGPQYLPEAFVGRASQQMDTSTVVARFFLALPRR